MIGWVASLNAEKEECEVDGDGGSVVLVEPFGAGGGPDLIASALAVQLTQIWAVPVTVDNRPGWARRLRRRSWPPPRQTAARC